MAIIYTPLYLLKAQAKCWKCSQLSPVVGFGTHYIEIEGERIGDLSNNADLILLTHIEKMPEEIFSFANQQNNLFTEVTSVTDVETLFANTCECGARFGDFYLYSEPEGAFCPQSAEEAKHISVEQLPFEGPFDFDCGYSWGAGEFIMAYSKRSW